MNCPSCNSIKVATILYGLVDVDEKMEEEIKNEKVVLGGCCVNEDSPRYICGECYKKWGRLEEIAEYKEGFDNLKMKITQKQYLPKG